MNVGFLKRKLNLNEPKNQSDFVFAKKLSESDNICIWIRTPSHPYCLPADVYLYHSISTLKTNISAPAINACTSPAAVQIITASHVQQHMQRFSSRGSKPRFTWNKAVKMYVGRFNWMTYRTATERNDCWCRERTVHESETGLVNLSWHIGQELSYDSRSVRLGGQPYVYTHIHVTYCEYSQHMEYTFKQHWKYISSSGSSVTFLWFWHHDTSINTYLLNLRPVSTVLKLCFY